MTGALGQRTRWRTGAGAVLACAALSAILAWLSTRPGLAQLDMLAYDRMLPLAAQPASDRILVVAIDERSMAALGRWPWPRSTHARLLSRLADAGADRVLLDLFLTEPSDDKREDWALAQAMDRLPVYLPMMARREARVPDEPATEGLVRPLPVFGERARGVGHAELLVDADGVARSLFMRMGPPGDVQPYVGVLVAGRAPGGDPGHIDGAGWRYEDPMRIAFAGPAGTYETVSYLRVLGGEYPAADLQGRTVLVGAIAAGLSDRVFAPVGAQAGVLPGVEVHANAIDQLVHGRAIHDPTTAGRFAWIAAVLTAAAAMLWLRPGSGVFAVLVAGLACTGSSALALWGLHWWVPVATPLVGLALLYGGWSWLRLRGQVQFLSRKARALQAVPTGIFEIATQADEGGEADAPQLALDRAIRRTLRLQALTESVLQALPVGVLLCDAQGRVVGGNAAAARWFGDGGEAAAASRPEGRPLAEALAGWRRQLPRAGGRAEVEPAWLAPLLGEYTTARGEHLQLLAAPVAGADHQAVPGYIVVLADLTSEREGQRRREKWNSFLSHDLRAPQVTILSLLDLDGGNAVPARLSESIRREAERTLTLAEQFLDVSHAWMGRYRFSPTHVATLMLDVRDQSWAAAQRAGVTVALRMDEAAEEIELPLDGALLVRALLNLVLNAIAHSPVGTCIRLCLAVESLGVALSVADEGVGMAPATLEQLLAGAGEATLGRDRGQGVTRSHGLGFEFARTVVMRHGGSLDGWSLPGAGCTLCIRLPREA